MQEPKQLQQLQEMVDRSRRIVFFGGAGVSTESGIPDFRSVTAFTTSAINIRRRSCSVTAFM